MPRPRRRRRPTGQSSNEPNASAAAHSFSADESADRIRQSVKPSLPTETQKKVDDVLKAIKPAKTAASDKNTIELKLAAAIRTMAVAINKAVPVRRAADKSKENAVFKAAAAVCESACRKLATPNSCDSAAADSSHLRWPGSRASTVR